MDGNCQKIRSINRKKDFLFLSPSSFHLLRMLKVFFRLINCWKEREKNKIIRVEWSDTYSISIFFPFEI